MCAASAPPLAAAPVAPAAASAALVAASPVAPAAASACLGTSCNQANGNLRSSVNQEPLPNQVVGLKS